MLFRKQVSPSHKTTLTFRTAAALLIHSYIGDQDRPRAHEYISSSSRRKHSPLGTASRERFIKGTWTWMACIISVSEWHWTNGLRLLPMVECVHKKRNQEPQCMSSKTWIMRLMGHVCGYMNMGNLDCARFDLSPVYGAWWVAGSRNHGDIFL
jgi:hypothetical protein